MQPLYLNVIFSDAQAHIIRYGFTTSLDATVKDVRHLAAERTYIRPEELLLLEVNARGFQRTLNDDSDCTSDALQVLSAYF